MATQARKPVRAAASVGKSLATKSNRRKPLMASTATAMSQAAMLVGSVFLNTRPMMASLEVSIISCRSSRYLMIHTGITLLRMLPSCSRTP